MSSGPEETGSKRRITAAQQKGAAYQGAMEAVFAILIAVGLGYWADDYFETAPRYLIAGAVLGFGAFVLRLMRLGEQMSQLSEQAASAARRSEEGQRQPGRGEAGEPEAWSERDTASVSTEEEEQEEEQK